MLPRGRRPVEGTLALASIEARQVSARQHGPDHVVAVHVHAARSKSLPARLRVVPRDLVDFRERGCRRIRSGHQTNQRARHAEDGTPDRSVDRTRRHAVERRVDSFVLRRIDRLIGLDVGVALAVAVRVQDEYGPPLRLLLVVRLVVHLRVEPALDRTAAGEPEHAVVVEIQVMRTEAGIDGRDLPGFWIVELHLPAVLRDWERHG